MRRRVRMRPLAAGPVRLPSRRGTGVLIRYRDDETEVFHVIADSPASLPGLRLGDRITHVNGVPVTGRGCRESDLAPDAVRFTVRRGEMTFDVEVPSTVLLH